MSASSILSLCQRFHSAQHGRLHERWRLTHGSVPWRRQAHHRLWPPRQTAVHCGPVALVSIVAARLRASMALEDVGAHRPAPGAWCASARAGSTTLDAGHGHEARLLRRSQQKLDSRLTGMCTDAADVIAATNTEIVPPARASSVPALVRQATVYRRLAARLNSSVAAVRIASGGLRRVVPE